jgi:catechol 2,3-dioxygenase-like lactoylglutathione lyase family enzyme
MSKPAPEVQCDLLHPTFAVTDVLAAVDFYENKLGFARGFTWGDPPRTAGVNLGEVSIHLVRGTPNPAGCSVYFVIGDADELHEFQRANGVDIVAAPEDKPWGLREYQVRDLHGHLLSFGHRLPEAGPPVEIERVDVPVRLEKRLAAALRDLAAHKHMSVDACLEETLMHTFEPVGTGVASPHNQRTLRFIQELKKKHGIDYDTHATYRFVEK